MMQVRYWDIVRCPLSGKFHYEEMTGSNPAYLIRIMERKYMDIPYVVSILKSALIVDASYKNELIQDAIKVLDPTEHDRMEKEFNDMLNEINSRK